MSCYFLQVLKSAENIAVGIHKILVLDGREFMLTLKVHFQSSRNMTFILYRLNLLTTARFVANTTEIVTY